MHAYAFEKGRTKMWVTLLSAGQMKSFPPFSPADERYGRPRPRLEPRGKRQLQHESSVHSTKYRSIGRETCQKKSIRRVKQKMTDIFVPTDLLAKILIRLPVKVILKFRCACKSWCNLISGEYFIDMHLELAKRSSRMILYPHTPYKPDCAVKLYSLNKESTADMVFSKSGLDTQGRPIMLLNACQGLNLLHSHTDIYVLNIWTREFARLPQGTPGLDASSSPCQFVGFGFSSTSKKYKVVRIFYHWVDRRSRTYSLGCEVYTLGVSGRWREVSPPPYPVHCRGVFSNGAILDG
uniref:F-box/kelch-repeat protein At2g43270 n=1 Tax=Anthurium amnicola TaxID=1678845 RepID=A0A1D1Z184_9ARAE